MLWESSEYKICITFYFSDVNTYFLTPSLSSLGQISAEKCLHAFHSFIKIHEFIPPPLNLQKVKIGHNLKIPKLNPSENL